MTESAPYTPPAGAPEGRTNTLAIIALIAGIVVPIVGIVIGHIALGQIKKTGENGRGLALAGTVIGYVLTVLYILIFLFSIIVPFLILGSLGGVYTG
jgi:peptidyl-prolyl cis-trans isomerase B (cyclophilin B)